MPVKNSWLLLRKLFWDLVICRWLIYLFNSPNYKPSTNAHGPHSPYPTSYLLRSCMSSPWLPLFPCYSVSSLHEILNFQLSLCLFLRVDSFSAGQARWKLIAWACAWSYRVSLSVLRFRASKCVVDLYCFWSDLLFCLRVRLSVVHFFRSKILFVSNPVSYHEALVLSLLFLKPNLFFL